MVVLMKLSALSRLAALLSVGALLLANSQTMAFQSKPIPEHQVKATFLFRFTQFVEWPAGAFPAAQAPLVIGVLGEDPFGPLLDETVRNEKVNEHPLAIERYTRLEDIKNVHVLFVSRRQAARIREITGALNGRSILTVGDADGFADGGGMIQFVTQENKIRLRINLTAARSANLTISSQLLRPAMVINSETK
jgi:hypothetical protein